MRLSFKTKFKIKVQLYHFRMYPPFVIDDSLFVMKKRSLTLIVTLTLSKGGGGYASAVVLSFLPPFTSGIMLIISPALLSPASYI